MGFHSLVLVALASSAAAVNLYVTSYSGNITTFQLDRNTLKPIAVNQQCGTSPTWLQIDAQNLRKETLYCVDEGFTAPATLNSYNVNRDGSLTRISSVITIPGPVSSIFYNEGKKCAVALAHYGGSAITTYLKSPEGQLTSLQNLTFTLPQPGPRPEQEASHVHHSVIDPTGQFLLFPDLGADLTRIYSFDSKTALLKEEPSLKADPASGPRHAVFWSPATKVRGGGKSKAAQFLFIIHELANKITSYSVSYPAAGGISFTKVGDFGLFGDRATPEGARAAEIAISPDNQFLLASNRNATLFNVANPNPNNSTQIPSDTIVSYKLSDDGKLAFQSLAPSGGSFPRHFSLNKDGSLVSITNQRSGSVVVWRRDPRTGAFGERVASYEGLGETTNSLWDEN
jgi:6-phosphogluconolactonase (cycloisomerase 2 family)